MRFRVGRVPSAKADPTKTAAKSAKKKPVVTEITELRLACMDATNHE